MSASILPCLVQEGQKQCGKILEEKFATNLKETLTLQTSHLTMMSSKAKF